MSSTTFAFKNFLDIIIFNILKKGKEMNNTQQREEKVQLAIEIAIKVGLLAMIIYISFLIAKPFMAIVVWGIIIAVALSPLINSLEKRFGSRKKVIIGFFNSSS